MTNYNLNSSNVFNGVVNGGISMRGYLTPENLEGEKDVGNFFECTSPFTAVEESIAAPVPVPLPVLSVPQTHDDIVKAVFEEALTALKTTPLHANMVSKLLKPEDAKAILNVFQIEISSNYSVAHGLTELVRLGVVTSAEQFDHMKPVFEFLCLCCMRNSQTGLRKFSVAEVNFLITITTTEVLIHLIITITTSGIRLYGKPKRKKKKSIKYR